MRAFLFGSLRLFRLCPPTIRPTVCTRRNPRSVDTIPYGLYSIDMARIQRQFHTTGAEEARKQLPALVAAAAEGRTTIITKHGRAVAAIVPTDSIKPAKKQLPITLIAGTGKGLWGKDSTKAIAKLRDEWSR